MRKFKFLLVSALTVFALSACNDSDGDYPVYRPLITTVHTLGENDYYFLRDNGEKLYPSDKSRVNGYKATDRQRAVIWFNLFSEKLPDYNYNIALYAIQNIYSSAARIITDPKELESLGDAATSILDTRACNLTKEWLTLYVGYPVMDNSKHAFTLIHQPSTTEENKEYLEVELRHNPNGDVGGYNRDYYVSFDMTPLQTLLDGKTGINLTVKTQLNGTVKLKFDLPAEK